MNDVREKKGKTSEAFLPFLKDLMELIRNLAFGLGICGLAFVTHAQHWTWAFLTSERIATAIALLGGGYIGVAIIYFMMTHQPHRWPRLVTAWWVIAFPAVLLVTLSAVFAAGYQFAWQQKKAHQETATLAPLQSPSSTTPAAK